MKPKLLFVALLFVGPMVLTQTQESQFKAISLSRSHLSQVHGTINDCLTVRVDGKFHWEHQTSSLQFQPPAISGREPFYGERFDLIATDIYEGKLTPDNLSALLAAINNEGFSAIPAAQQGTRCPRDSECIQVHLLRFGSTKRLMLDENLRRKYKADLKPLFDWWAGFDKQKLVPNTTAFSHPDCASSPDRQ